jgi:hypothetical protein
MFVQDLHYLKSLRKMGGQIADGMLGAAATSWTMPSIKVATMCKSERDLTPVDPTSVACLGVHYWNSDLYCPASSVRLVDAVCCCKGAFAPAAPLGSEFRLEAESSLNRRNNQVASATRPGS